DLLFRLRSEAGAQEAQERHAGETLVVVARVGFLRTVQRILGRTALMQGRRTPRAVGILVAHEPAQSIEHGLLGPLRRSAATLFPDIRPAGRVRRRPRGSRGLLLASLLRAWRRSR